MQIRRATLGMAPADYVTNCADCRASLVKARGDAMFHHYDKDHTGTRTLCRDCAGHRCLDDHLTRALIAASESTARIIRETRSH